MRCAVSLILVGLVAASGAPLAASCTSRNYVVHGIVTDEAGQPLAKARIYLLLDKVSEKKSVERGFRAVPVQAGEDGRFVAAIDCAAHDSARGAERPDPCAKKPRHVTVFVGQEGFGAQARVFRMKDLVVVESNGRCTVGLPEIRLRAER